MNGAIKKFIKCAKKYGKNYVVIVASVNPA